MYVPSVVPYRQVLQIKHQLQAVVGVLAAGVALQIRNAQGLRELPCADMTP